MALLQKINADFEKRLSERWNKDGTRKEREEDRLKVNPQGYRIPFNFDATFKEKQNDR